MNLHNALGFVGVGLAMKFLPVLFPSVVHSDGESARALWLAFMSFVMMGVAGIWFGHRVVLEAKARWAAAQAALAARRAAATAGAAATNRSGAIGAQ